MTTDLDQPYILNGDDLRLALAGTEGRPPLVPNPGDVAAYILGRIAKPYGGPPVPVGCVSVTESHVREALDGQWVFAENRDGTHHAQIRDSASVAREVFGKLRDISSAGQGETPGGVIRVEQLAAWFRQHEFGTRNDRGYSFIGKATVPEQLAELILTEITGKAHPMPVDAEITDDETRWPMGRGEAETRLSLALDGKDILIGRDPAPGGERRYVRALDPGGLAAELVNAIDRQGTVRARCQSCSPPPGEDGGHYPCNCAAACGARYCQHPLTGTDPGWPTGPQACPDAEPDAGIAALGICHGALTILGDPVAARRIIRYLADEFDVETIPG